MKSPFVLTLLALSTHAFAQTPGPSAPPANVTATPVVAAPAQAPAPTAEAVAPNAPQAPAISDLPIPVPANANVKVEIDATNGDLLGQVKDILSGINAQDMLDTMIVGESTDETTGRLDVSKRKHRMPPELPESVAHISMADVLHNINHVHLLVINLPEPTPAPMTHAGAVHPKGAQTPTGLAPLSPGEQPSTPVVSALTANKIASFYETSFHNNGGRRVIWLNQEPVCFLMESFPGKGGTAMVLQLPASITILRSDGNLDLKPMNALFSAAMHEAADWVRAQQSAN